LLAVAKILASRGRARATVCALALTVVLAAGLAIPSASLAFVPTLSIARAPIVAPIEGEQLSGLVATAESNSGLLASEFNAAIEWGDGTTQSATITDSAGAITLSGSHIYAAAGAFTVTATIEDPVNHLKVSVSTTITVPDAPLSAPFSSSTTFSGAGAASTNTALSAFQAAIGGANNGTTAGEQPAGFRRVGWDEIALDGSAPGTTVMKSGQTVALAASSEQERGLELGSSLAVSGDRFASINPEAAGLFTPFSATNLAAPLNTNALVLNIVAPGAPGSTPTPAVTRGLGVVFLNVAIPNTTSVEYLDGDTVLGKFFAPVGGHNHPSFVGVLFDSPVITRVVITLGTAEILNFDGSFSSGGLVSDSSPNNLVAADDVVLAEPAPDGPTLRTTAGNPLTGTLARFKDANPGASAHDFTATVDWGDGARSDGTIAADASGHFTVSGTHTFAQAGTFPLTIGVRDLGGAQATFHATATVIALVLPPATPAAPTPLPASPAPIAATQPSCSLSSAHSAKLARLPGLSASAASPAAVRKTHGKSPHIANRLRVVVRCNQDVSVLLLASLLGTTPAGRPRTSATAAREGFGGEGKLRLASVSAHLAANRSTTLTLALSASALVKLHAAAGRRKALPLRLALRATSAQGIFTTIVPMSLRL